jgi:hypothetical protein
MTPDYGYSEEMICLTCTFLLSGTAGEENLLREIKSSFIELCIVGGSTAYSNLKDWGASVARGGVTDQCSVIWPQNHPFPLSDFWNLRANSNDSANLVWEARRHGAMTETTPHQVTDI